MNANTHDIHDIHGTLVPLFETLRAASRAQPAWDWPARARRLRALRALLLRERDAICAAIAADFGQRPRQETELAELFPGVPRIAIESHGSKERFWKLFNERMEVAHQALQFRIMRCKQATPVNAPTLFRFGAFGLVATGYPSPVLVLPTVSAQLGRVGANLIAVPNLPGYSGYLGLQLRFALD